MEDSKIINVTKSNNEDFLKHKICFFYYCSILQQYLSYKSPDHKLLQQERYEQPSSNAVQKISYLLPF